MKESDPLIGAARVTTQVSALAVDLSACHAKLEVRISGGEHLMRDLADLRLALLLAAGRREDGTLVDAAHTLVGKGDTASILTLEPAATAVDLHALVLRLTRFILGLTESEGDRQRWLDACEGFLDARERAEAWHPGSWLMALADPTSDMAAAVLAAGIVSDSAYLERESTLPMELRLAVARRRFDFGCHAAGLNAAGEPVFLGRLAAAVPPWIVDFTPELVECISPLRALQKQGIGGFGQLASMTPEQIQSRITASPAVQRTWLMQLNARLPDLARSLLWQELAGISLGGDDPVELADFRNFKSLVAWLLGQLDDRDRRQAQRILAARIGEPTIATFQTMEALAASLPDLEPDTSSGGRERARRLQTDAVQGLRRIPRSAALLRQLDAAIQDYLGTTGSVLPLGPECPIPALASSEPAAVERFLDVFFRDRRLPVYRRSDDGEGIVLAAAASRMDGVLSELEGVLRNRRLPVERERRRLEPQFQGVIQRYPNVSHDMVDREFTARLNWSDDSDRPEARVVSLGSTAAAAIVAVLARAGRPMERSEIADSAARPPFKLSLPASTLANALAALTADPRNRQSIDVYEAVFQVGHGLYASHADLPLTIEDQGPLAERVVQRVRDGRRSIRPHDRFGDAYQWHCVDLLAELEATDEAGDLQRIEPERRWYLLDAILRYHRPDGLVNLQKGYWMQQVAGLHPDAHEKIDQNEVVEWVLETHGNGQPMAIAEVRELVGQVQSLGATGQLQVASRLPRDGRIEKSGRGMLDLAG